MDATRECGELVSLAVARERGAGRAGKETDECAQEKESRAQANGIAALGEEAITTEGAEDAEEKKIEVASLGLLRFLGGKSSRASCRGHGSPREYG